MASPLVASGGAHEAVSSVIGVELMVGAVSVTVCGTAGLRAGTALAGETGPLADVVALNAGAALHVAGLTDSIGEGIERARAEMSAGSALRVLDRYVLSSRDTASTEARRA